MPKEEVNLCLLLHLTLFFSFSFSESEVDRQKATDIEKEGTRQYRLLLIFSPFLNMYRLFPFVEGIFFLSFFTNSPPATLSIRPSSKICFEIKRSVDW